MGRLLRPCGKKGEFPRLKPHNHVTVAGDNGTVIAEDLAITLPNAPQTSGRFQTEKPLIAACPYCSLRQGRACGVGCQFLENSYRLRDNPAGRVESVKTGSVVLGRKQ